ncbi:7856_t:CDS:2, partial [Scutellospora calospora]
FHSSIQQIFLVSSTSIDLDLLIFEFDTSSYLLIRDRIVSQSETELAPRIRLSIE